MTTLLIAEHHADGLDPLTAHALSAALALGEPVHVLAVTAAAAAAAARLHGVVRVLLADDASLEHRAAVPLAALIMSLAPDYAVFVAAATSTGKDVMPRVAALLDVMQISDIVAVVSPDTFKRPIYAGNAIETVQSLEVKKVITVRASAFPATGEGGSAEIITIGTPASPGLGHVVSESAIKSERPGLSSARVVVSGGRAFGSKEKFDALLTPLAEKLGAAIGASRAAVDAGYASNELQVGQTGRVVAPDLYIACGISGAVQHLAGMKESKVIVAINSDPSAPIFAVADYGLVGDIFEILSALTAAL
jgi:electron transfer flavoprotein alpha subunit